MAKSVSLSTQSQNWVLAAMILASSMASIDASALNVALPAIQRSLNADATQLVWVVNAYALMLAALILVGGALGDHLGRKKIMLVGISLFVGCSAACAVAPSIEWLIAARTGQGLGGALLIPGSLAIITALFDDKQRGKAIGTWSAAGALTGLAGPLLGGLLAGEGLWRVVFLLNIPLGLAAWAIIYRSVPENRDESANGPVDYIGGGAASLGLASLTYSFTMWSTLGPAQPAVYGTLIGGIIGLTGFVWYEMRQPRPLVPMSLFSVGAFAGTNLLTLFLYGALSIVSFFLSLNLVQLQGYRPALAGLAFMPLPLPLILLSRWVGKLSDQYGPRQLLISGPIVTGLGFLGLSLIGLTKGASDYWLTFMPCVLTMGIGLTLTVAPLTNTVMGAVPNHYAGTASGINNAVARAAAVLALAVAGSVVLATFRHQLRLQIDGLPLPAAVVEDLQAKSSQLGGTPIPAGISASGRASVHRAIQLAFLHSFQVIMWVCTGLAWLSAIMAAFWVKRRQKKPRPPVNQ
ncbi:MFS transporter [Spirosoma foliorum]|uniref:MFS transporter n=1 Tax=Spirosoma foliorum TaxID=2710596 RepID=A0A7G5H0M4_9BACT|nr:MFS transporter [Spirosoma foliorum]QMW04666.1 MFS transporter [Spirosoma foliorum]